MLLKSPVMIIYQVKISFNLLIEYIKINFAKILIYSSIMLFLFVIIREMFKKYIIKFIKKWQGKISLVGDIKKTVSILHSNFIQVALGLFFLIVIIFSNIPDPSNSILISISLCFLAIVLWLSFIGILFNMKSIVKSLAIKAKIIGVAFILAVSFYNLAKLSSASVIVILVYEKLLFIVSILFTLLIRSLVKIYLEKEHSDEEKVLVRAIITAMMIAPWVVIIFLMTGIIGYSTLSWVLIKYTSILIGFLWLIIYGLNLINDLRKTLKMYCIKHYNHGAFIAQDVVSPLTTLLKIIWAILLFSILFSIFKWNKESLVISRFFDVINYPVATFASIQLNIKTLILLVVSLSFIMKLGKWFKSVSYRWIYSNISDLGIRNSLSTFTQYIIFTVGFLVMLNILGFDLTSLAVFAGALGVGVGLGLQDIAKNFISGILILIERPLKTGDTVTIDNVGGDVKRIGMRAITLETFDKEEVIIPNSGVISNGFSNWTHSNSILRTVLYVGADYASAPHKVMAVLQEILENDEDILEDPSPMVVMWEYGDSSINYRIQYYVDMSNSSLFATRTRVLSSVWYEFSKNNIEIPFPQRDLYIKTINSNNTEIEDEKENIEEEAKEVAYKNKISKKENKGKNINNEIAEANSSGGQGSQFSRDNEIDGDS